MPNLPRPTHIFDPIVTQTIATAQAAADALRTKKVKVNGKSHTVRSPFPSPGDWRDRWIYFLMIDRFNNPAAPPRGTWNRRFDFRQGGTLKGVQAQLGYLEQLGVKAIWLSPVLKNSRPDWQYNYHGYGQQDFLNVDERFASDGLRATAEKELIELIDEAHARDIHVVLDIVLNHSARAFDYVREDGVKSSFADAAVMNGSLGCEPPVQWLNGFGFPRADWQDALPVAAALSADDAVWPSDLQDRTFFRRRGSKLTDDAEAAGFVRGDFGDMRQLVVEYVAGPSQQLLRDQYGISPVLAILVRAHQYLVARYDFDGFRIDTVKYVQPQAIETFGNAMREFALTLGKTNFFTFGEVYDNEATIARFIGRNAGSNAEGYGIDAALDFPLFYTLPGVAKGMIDVAQIRRVFEDRKRVEVELLSSHGDAGRFFVSFVDNHDQKERIQHPATPIDQVTLAIALLFTMQGIPSLYYGTEQGLSGTLDANGKPELDANESSREALWGKPNAFDVNDTKFKHIQKLSRLRASEPALRYGRFYFREVSGSDNNFGHSFGAGGIVAFSRILVDREVLIVANTGAKKFTGAVIVDRDINASPRPMQVAYSNKDTVRMQTVRRILSANFYKDGQLSAGPAAALDVILEAGEVQVFKQV